MPYIGDIKGNQARMERQMTEVYSLNNAGIECWDVFTKTGRFAGLIVTKKDGTLRHYYNSECTKGSSRKFSTINDALDNISKRQAFLQAKRGT